MGNMYFNDEDISITDHKKDMAREASAAYVMGLKDAGLVTERERQVLFVYTTV